MSDSQENQHSDQPSHGHGDGDSTAWIAEAILDAQVSIPPVLGRFLATVDGIEPAHIIDLGCGPGVGTSELAAQFQKATITGLDLDDAALASAAERAAELGIADRASFATADFDSGFADQVEAADLLWASMSLHHTPDPAVALANACDAVRSGGRIALAEFGPPINMWPSTAEAVTSGLWDRWQAAFDAAREGHLGSAAFNVRWLDLMETLGLERIERIECPIRFPAPLAGRERDWLTSHLTRGLKFTDGSLDADDRAEIERLLDRDNPRGVARSTEIFVDYGRDVYTGIKP